MIKNFLLLALLSLPAVSAYSQSAVLGRNLFPEGSFDIFGESRLMPSGWTFPDVNDRPWQAGFRADAVKGTGGNKELRIVNPDFGYTAVGAKVMLPPKTNRVRISYRIFAKAIELGPTDSGGNGAGIYFRFRDKDANSLSAGWVGETQNQVTGTNWQEIGSSHDLPAGATEVDLEIIFRSAKGEVRVDDVKVVPVAK